MTKQLPFSYLLLPKRNKDTKTSRINPTSNFTVTKQLPVCYLLLPKWYKDTKIIENESNIQILQVTKQSVIYCYQRDIRTQKSSKINPTSSFTVTKLLTVSYLLLPKRYKDIKSSKINPTSNFTVTKQLSVSYLLLPKRYKDTKIIENKSNIQFYSDQAVTSQLPTVTKEI